jgi:hypothetical protein
MIACARCFPGFLRPTAGALAFLVMAAVLPGPARAEQASPSFAQGTHFFRRLLHDLDLRPLRTFDELVNDPSKNLLIVLGEATYQDPNQIAAFVRRGGVVLLATDRDCHTVLQPFGVQVLDRRLAVAADTRFAYKGFEECIFVEPQGRNSPLFDNLTVDGGLSRVATNRPGCLVRAQGCELQTLATFPRDCRPMYPRTVRRERSPAVQPDPFPFAVGGDWGQGRILVLSDHSVFINAMMWQTDNENFDFAYNCVNWLMGRGQRTHVLFLEEGHVQRLFEVPLAPPPLPPLPSLKEIVETADKGLGELERNNAFNQAIANAVREASPSQDAWERVVVLMATLALAALALARLSQARQRQEKAQPLAASAPESTASASGLYEQRHQALVREGNFWEAARALARQGFESALDSPAQGDGQASASAALARLGVQGRGWGKWRFRRRFNQLWQLAYGTEPVRISSRQFRRLDREIERMKAALDHDLPLAQVTRGGQERK